MKLMPHQQAALDRNASHELWCWSMRTGKTMPGAMWLHLPEQNRNPYILCLKKDKKQWQKAANTWCPNATVLTKEEFKKAWEEIDDPSAVLIDEAHWSFGAVFTNKRSKQAECVYNFIRKWPDLHVLLTTATPVRNDPSSLHTALCYIGHFIPWRKWQDEMYELVQRPYLPRPAWMPKPDWRERCKPYLEKHADIVKLEDVVEYLPPETHEVVNIKTKKYKYAEDEERRWTTEHQHEQEAKVKYLTEMGDQMRKIIIIAHYTSTIELLEDKLSKQKPVYVLNGKTKDGDETIKKAQSSDDCYFIVQASMASGFDGYMFDAMVFTAMSHKVVDYIQATGRLHHTKHVKPAVYYYLLAEYTKGRSWDQAVYASIKAGKDFYATAGTTQENESS